MLSVTERINDELQGRDMGLMGLSFTNMAVGQTLAKVPFRGSVPPYCSFF